ncbi:class I SAM-dependent methyltransferase [Achromobacter aloeverae]
MQNNKGDLLADVAEYYSDKLAAYGVSARGVDWNGEESQTVRFGQLCGIIATDAIAHSLNDLGCGYGALLEFVDARHPISSYLGIDVSADMIRAAAARHEADPRARFIRGVAPDRVADYGIASGIFNVRLGRSDTEWNAYMIATLDIMDRTSGRGFAFNCLTSYSDEDKKRDYLYYADPCQLFDLCKRRYSKQVALLHDYGLYEFTILVRK